MKKLFVLLSVFILCSCSGNYREPTSSTNGTQIMYVEGTSANTEIQKVEYDGHRYILVISRWGEGVGTGLVHDPDCNCGRH